MTAAGETEIRELDRTTVERIAAGEVVERPASVVKELVENSLDADAGRIDVSVEGDGTERIQITDDGVGMSEADVRTAVRKHTTSKITDIEDLEAGVGTLGFRGEALATIGAVSRTTIRTKPRAVDADAGTELELTGGEVTHVGPAGCPEGTSIEVTDLFFNTPARKKYLKTQATEFAHVNTIATQYALANPDVAVSLSHDDREVFATTGRGDLQSAILSVYGRDVATSMIRVEGAADGVEVTGFASDPETTRSTRDYLSTYVNGRYVTAKTVREAVLDAYGKQLAPNRYPFAVLFLDVDPGSVDVNVHPRKMEVRFDDEGRVERAVREAVESALLSHGLVRSSAPRGRSAPGDAEVSPESEQTALDAMGPTRTDAVERSDEEERTGEVKRTDEEDVADRSGREHPASPSRTDRPTGASETRTRTDERPESTSASRSSSTTDSPSRSSR